MAVAQDLGFLRVPPGVLVDGRDIGDHQPERLVLVSTGSQGEPMSALSRMAKGTHHQIRVDPDDVVILASSLVPGNETAVFRVINALSRLGATVVHGGVASVHVSGHAPAGELLYLLNATRPSNVMPVHGEWRHLRAHGRLAELTGVPADRVILAEDGVVVDLVDGLARISGKVECGLVYVDGNVVGDVGEESLRDRRVLGEEGFLAITIVVEPSTRTIVREPHVSTRGFSDAPGAFDELLPLIEKELARQLEDGVSDTHRLAQAVRRVAGKWVADTYRRRPMILPTVLEV